MAEEVIIEELDSCDIPESELSEFKVIDSQSIVPGTSTDFLNSGISNPDYIEEDDEDYNINLDDDDEDEDGDPDDQVASTSRKKGSVWLKNLLKGNISQGIDEEILPEQEFPIPKFARNKLKDDLLKPKLGNQKKYKKSLPIALQGLMGEANLCYVRGNTEMAEKICLEIIRQAPLASEPYITLSQIYESVDDDKHLQFLLIAAHLNPSESQWSRIADMLIEKGQIKQAIECLTKAIKCEPKNIPIRLQRIQLLESIGEEKHALRCYFLMIPYIPTEEHEFLINTAKDVAHKFHKEGNIQSALEALTKAYDRVRTHFKTEDVNLFLELLIANQQYRKALSVLVFHTEANIHVQHEDEETDEIKIEDIYIPDGLILDFRTKLAVILIHLKAFSVKTILINNLLKFVDIESDGDCYLDVAEALMKEKQFADALLLLDPLVKSENFSLAAVWLRHADCLRSIGNCEEAIKSYKIVVEMSQHLDARLTLSALLKQQNRMEEALEALSQDFQTEIIDPILLKEKCLLLRDMERIDEYLHNGYLFLLRHVVHFKSRIELATVCAFLKINDRVNELKNMRKTREETTETLDVPEFNKTSNPITVEEEWNFYLDLLKAAHKYKRFAMLQKLAFSVMGSKKLQSYIKEIDFLGLLSCLYNKEEHYGYNIIKQFVVADSPRLWNLFNLIILVTQDYRYYRYIDRYFNKVNIHPIVYMLSANYYLMSNNYKYALDYYVAIFKRYEIPLIALILSVIYAQIASQKYSNKKQNLILQSIAFIEKYHEIREPEAMNEIYYNTGRLYHQIGMVHLAKSYYEKALRVSNELILKHPQLLDLRAEIAFNLHLIYKTSGNLVMARKVLYDNIIV